MRIYTKTKRAACSVQDRTTTGVDRPEMSIMGYLCLLRTLEPMLLGATTRRAGLIYQCSGTCWSATGHSTGTWEHGMAWHEGKGSMGQVVSRGERRPASRQDSLPTTR